MNLKNLLNLLMKQNKKILDLVYLFMILKVIQKKLKMYLIIKEYLLKNLNNFKFLKKIKKVMIKIRI